jgi:hypothetical protein
MKARAVWVGGGEVGKLLYLPLGEGGEQYAPRHPYSSEVAHSFWSIGTPYLYRPVYGTIKKSTVIYEVHNIRLGYIKMFDIYFFSTAQCTTHAQYKN